MYLPFFCDESGKGAVFNDLQKVVLHLSSNFVNVVALKERFRSVTYSVFCFDFQFLSSFSKKHPIDRRMRTFVEWIAQLVQKPF